MKNNTKLLTMLLMNALFSYPCANSMEYAIRHGLFDVSNKHPSTTLDDNTISRFIEQEINNSQEISNGRFRNVFELAQQNPDIK